MLTNGVGRAGGAKGRDSCRRKQKQVTVPQVRTPKDPGMEIVSHTWEALWESLLLGGHTAATAAGFSQILNPSILGKGSSVGKWDLMHVLG